MSTDSQNPRALARGAVNYRERRALGLVTPRPHVPPATREAILRDWRAAPERIGRRGKRRRGVTRAQLARKYGVAYSTVSRFITAAR